MTKAVEKIDRFLERYKQLCLEEGVFIQSDNGEMFLEWVEESLLQDNIDAIKSETVREIPYDSKWKGLDKK